MTTNQIHGLFSFADEKYISEAFPQAKRAPVVTTRRIAAIAASVCVFVTAIMAGILIPSFNNPDGITDNGGWWTGEVGDKDIVEGTPSVMINTSSSCAYSIAENGMDIENVNITLYYGCELSEEETYSERNIIVFFGTYPDAKDYTKELLLVRDNLVNFNYENYNMTRVLDERRHLTEVLYNHSENVNIPKDFLLEQKGRLYIYALSHFSEESGIDYHNVGAWHNHIYYKIIDNKVYFYCEKYEDNELVEYVLLQPNQRTGIVERFIACHPGAWDFRDFMDIETN